MQLQKNFEAGPLMNTLIQLAQAKKDEKKPVEKKDEKKKPEVFDEDLERANREQEAINKNEYASVQVIVKVAGDDCPCKDHGGCKCGGNKVHKTFKPTE